MRNTSYISMSDKRRINNEFRKKDDSNLWPICGRFSVAERAIRRARKLAQANGEFSSAYEYQMVLENICSEIVNNSDNW